MSRLASTNWRNDWIPVDDDEISIRETTPHQSRPPVLSAEQGRARGRREDQGSLVQAGDPGVAAARADTADAPERCGRGTTSPRVGENIQMTDTIEGKSMSRDYGEMLTDATEINGESARLKRRNNINSFISEAKGWLQHLDNRGNGPSLKEAQRIVEDLREKLDKIP